MCDYVYSTYVNMFIVYVYCMHIHVHGQYCTSQHFVYIVVNRCSTNLISFFFTGLVGFTAGRSSGFAVAEGLGRGFGNGLDAATCSSFVTVSVDGIEDAFPLQFADSSVGASSCLYSLYY